MVNVKVNKIQTKCLSVILSIHTRCRYYHNRSCQSRRPSQHRRFIYLFIQEECVARSQDDSDASDSIQPERSRVDLNQAGREKSHNIRRRVNEAQNERTDKKDTSTRQMK